jgi:DNA-directed RNA polymerase subunit RPC12/RpoP
MRVYRCPKHPDRKTFNATAREYHDWTVNSQGEFIDDLGPTDSELLSVSCPGCGVLHPIEMSAEEVRIEKLKTVIADLLVKSDLELVRGESPISAPEYECRYCGHRYFMDHGEGILINLLCTSDDCPAVRARKAIQDG